MWLNSTAIVVSTPLKLKRGGATPAMSLQDGDPSVPVVALQDAFQQGLDAGRRGLTAAPAAPVAAAAAAATTAVQYVPSTAPVVHQIPAPVATNPGLSLPVVIAIAVVVVIVVVLLVVFCVWKQSAQVLPWAQPGPTAVVPRPAAEQAVEDKAATKGPTEAAVSDDTAITTVLSKPESPHADDSQVESSLAQGGDDDADNSERKQGIAKLMAWGLEQGVPQHELFTWANQEYDNQVAMVMQAAVGEHGDTEGSIKPKGEVDPTDAHTVVMGSHEAPRTPVARSGPTMMWDVARNQHRMEVVADPYSGSEPVAK